MKLPNCDEKNECNNCGKNCRSTPNYDEILAKCNYILHSTDEFGKLYIHAPEKKASIEPRIIKFSYELRPKKIS